MMRTTGVTLSILSTFLRFTSGQIGNPNYVAFDANSTAPSDGYASFRKADGMPNETHTVMFTHDNTMTDGKNWTWTLKISDVLMPNHTGTDLDTLQPNPPLNAHVAFTTYDFAWPSGGSLNQAVAEGENLNSPVTTSDPSCMYMIWAQFPLNVSAKYDPSSSDCTSALGEECVNAIVSGMSGGPGCETSNFPSYFTFRDECANSFGAIEGGGWATQAYAFGNATAPTNQTSLQSGGTWAWALSNPYAPDNSTAFETEKERLRVIGLSSSGQNQLLCNRIADTVENRSSLTGRVGGLMVVSVVAMVVAVVNAL